MNNSDQSNARVTERKFAPRWMSVALLAALTGCQTMPTNTPSSNANAVSTSVNSAQPQGDPGCQRLGGNTSTENAGIGAAGGAVLGALLGSGSGKHGARNGALIGALGGALVGSQYNKMIGMSELPDGSVKMNIPGAVMFRSGSSDISPEFGATLTSVGNTVRQYCGLTALVIGYTDSVGSADLNNRLSYDRANAVVNYLVRQGVNPGSLRGEGHGMNDPIASNATDAGRAANRRVEIYVRPSAQ